MPLLKKYKKISCVNAKYFYCAGAQSTLRYSCYYSFACKAVFESLRCTGTSAYHCTVHRPICQLGYWTGRAKLQECYDEMFELNLLVLTPSTVTRNLITIEPFELTIP